MANLRPSKSREDCNSLYQVAQISSQYALDHGQHDNGPDDYGEDRKIEGSKTLVDMPKTVPAAGGCSVSVIAIRTIIAPTDAARAKSRSAPTPSRMLLTSGANRTSENTDPTSRARKWPPNSALGAADLLVG